MANARTPVDDGDEGEESQHGTFPEASLGLEGLKIATLIGVWIPLITANHVPIQVFGH